MRLFPHFFLLNLFSQISQLHYIFAIKSLKEMDSRVILLSLFIITLLSFYLELCYFQYSFLIIKHILLNGINMIIFFAVYSSHIQITGLIGKRGLIPLSITMETIDKHIKHCSSMVTKYSLQNKLMIFMLSMIKYKYSCKDHNSINHHIKLLHYIDFILLIIVCIYPNPLIYCYIYLSYYSLKRICGPFFNFQWDVLLLEVLILTALLSIASTIYEIIIVIWLLKFILFRLMFGSGIIVTYYINIPVR